MTTTNMNLLNLTENDWIRPKVDYFQSYSLVHVGRCGNIYCIFTVFSYLCSIVSTLRWWDYSAAIQELLASVRQTCAKFFIVSQGAKLYQTLRKFASALASKCRHPHSFYPHSSAKIRIQICTTIVKSAFKSAKQCRN